MNIKFCMFFVSMLFICDNLCSACNRPIHDQIYVQADNKSRSTSAPSVYTNTDASKRSSSEPIEHLLKLFPNKGLPTVFEDDNAFLQAVSRKNNEINNVINKVDSVDALAQKIDAKIEELKKSIDNMKMFIK